MMDADLIYWPAVLAFGLACAAAGFLLNAAFGPRRVVVKTATEADVIAKLLKDVEAKTAAKPADDATAGLAIWKTKTVTKPARAPRAPRKATKPGAKVKTKG